MEIDEAQNLIKQKSLEISFHPKITLDKLPTARWVLEGIWFREIQEEEMEQAQG